MRSTTVSTPDVSVTSGAGFDVLNDANGLTLAAVAVGAVSCGGALFVGAAVAPGQVLGGLAVATTLAVGGEVKNKTGHYLPFLHSDDTVTDTQAQPAAA